MRFLAILVLAAPVSCATRPQPQAVAANGPEVTLALSTSQQGSVLVAEIRNASGAPMCISAEAIRNADTTETTLRLRDSRGRSLARFPEHPHSYNPLRETVRLEAGASVEARYHLDSRFPEAADERPLRAGLSGRARFHYGNCGPIEAYCEGRIGICPDVWSSRADSGWQAL